MLSGIIHRIVNYWLNKGIIDESDIDIYEYGFELVLTSVINMTVVIITSMVVRKLTESIVLLAIVIPLQSCGGGYHAKTHLRCFLIMYIGWWVVIHIISIVTPFLAVCIAFISLIIIYLFAPVTHENVPMSDTQYYKMKVLVRGFATENAIAGIAISLYAESGNNIVKSIVTGMGVVALSILAARFRSYYLMRKDSVNYRH